MTKPDARRSDSRSLAADFGLPASFVIRSRKAGPFVICLLLAGMVWVVYSQTLQYQFVSYDDSVYVYENPVVKEGITIHGIAWALTFNEIGHWHPVTWLSHMLDCQLYGLQAGRHHLTNVLLHAASVILLFLVLRQMTGTLWRSAFVAAVFAVHPLHVESVAWVAERKDVLSGLFFMLTLGAYTCYARSLRSITRYTIVAALFALGLMCKGMLVTLPFVLLLLDWWPLCRWQPDVEVDRAPVPREGRETLPRLLLEKVPLLALSLASCVITSLAPEKLAAFEKLSFPQRVENALVSCMIYLRQMVWPTGLAVPYPNPAGDVPAGEVLAALALLAAISLAAFIFKKKHPWLAVGWLWYLGMLVPVIGIVQISYYARADRYTYLPQIGLYIAVAWLAAEGSARLRWRGLWMGGLSAVVLAALMLCARIQASYWKDDQTLWNHTLAVMPNNPTAHNNLGHYFEERKELDKAIEQYREAIKAQPSDAIAHGNLGIALLKKGPSASGEAIAHFRTALELLPDYAAAHDGFGDALLDRGDVDEAIAHYNRALEIEPHFAKARNNLGNAYLKKGNIYMAITQYEAALKLQPGLAEAHFNLANGLLQAGQPDEAAAQLQKALEIQPDFAQANYNLGMILAQTGHPGEAIAQFQKALASQPRDAETHVSLGNVLLRNGRLEDAVAQFQKALEIKPNLAKAHTNLAVALVQEGKPEEAMAHLQKAIEIEPGLAKARSNLGVILLQSRRLDEAVAQFQKALEIQPAFADAHYNLGLALSQKGQYGDAIDHLQKAINIQPGYTDAQNRLAYVLATCPQESLRNGTKAVELASQANEAAHGGNPAILGTLAAAYAETGKFPEAVETAQRAIDLANSLGDSKLAASLGKQIELYRNKTPLRDTGANNTGEPQ